MDQKTCAESGSGCQCTCTSESDARTEQLLAWDVMQCGVVSVDRKESVQNAVMLLIERDISGMPVTHEGRLNGMLSEKDLLKLLYETQYLPGLVEDYMSDTVTSFNAQDKLTVIHQHLVENSFRRVPILHEDKIAGMITRSDLVRVYKERFRPPAETSDCACRDELLAEDAMRCGLLTVYPDSSLYDAMDMIAKHRVTGLPVVDRGMNLLGIITEKDVLDCVDNPDAVGATVEPFMTRNVVSFDRKASLHRICECLIENSFHRVPILDGTRLVGIVSRSDILKHRASVFKH